VADRIADRFLTEGTSENLTGAGSNLETILGTYMLPGVAGILEARLPGTWWTPGARFLEARGFLGSL
jgi:hypothetical protein